MRRSTPISALMILAGTTLAVAGDDETWVGQAVMVRRPDVKFVDVNSEGKEREVQMSDVILRVLREEEGRLRVWSAGTEAWVPKNDTVLVRDAPAHYTKYLRGRSDSSWAWHRRGVAWKELGELDNAIKDFAEAIRIDPNQKAVFISRGNAWLGKKDYNKAIQDYDEAIRLEPNDASAFNGRAVVRAQQKDYDHAIRDFDEAIRLDSDFVHAINNR